MNLTPRNIRKIIFIIACAIILFVIFTNLGFVVKAIKKVLEIFSPVIVGCCIAFVLNVVMRLFDNILFKPMDKSKVKFIRKAKRPLSLLCSIILVAGIIALAVLVIAPQVEEALGELIRKLPTHATNLMTWVKDILVQLNVSAQTIEEIASDWTQIVKLLQNYLMQSSGSFLDSAYNITMSVVGVFVELVLGLFIASYILLKKERIAQILSKAGRAFLPEKRYLRVERIAKLTNSAFTNFISGQCIEAVILGTLCFLGMLIFDFPYAAVVSVLVAVTALVPIFGAWIGGGVSALLILMEDPMKALLFIVFLLILQQLEGNLIYPRVVGKSVGLPGLLVLVAVIVGQKIGGIVGMLVAVPVVSICYALFKEAVDTRLLKKEKKKMQQEAATESAEK